jgi:hypothetical protein
MSNQETNDRDKKSKWVALIKWLFLSSLGLFVALFLLLKLPPIQNFLATYLTNVLSKNLNVPVEVEKVHVELPGAIIIDDFYLEDLNQDTLVFAEKVQLDIESGFLGLLRKEVIVKSIDLKGIDLNLKRASGGIKNNLQLLLESRSLREELKDSLESKSSKPLALDIRRLNLEDLNLYNSNVPNGNNTSVQLSNATIDVGSIDLENQIFNINRVNINGLFVDVFLYDWEVDSTLIEDKNIIATADEIPDFFFEEESGALNLKIPDSVKVEGMLLTLDRVKGSNNSFKLTNTRSFVKPVIREGSVDYSNMLVEDINFNFNAVKFVDKVFTAENSDMNFEEQSGFVCERLYANELELSSDHLNLFDMELRTDKSVLGDSISLNFKEYSAFSRFPFEVSLDVRLNEGMVAVEDVMKVAPSLRDNRFFTLNSTELFMLSGQVKGVVDDLRGRDIDIQLGRDFRLNGDFSFQHLLDIENRFLSLNLDQCRTSVYAIKNLIPFVSLPDNFNKLGRLNFKGGFSGFFNNFNAYGELETEIGVANMDMNMDIKGGKELASYKGQLNLSDFDLAYWTGVEDLGKVYFSSTLEDGKGLTANTASAILNASIDTLEYKGYKYKDLAYAGKLDKNTVSGGFLAKDENFDIYFNGRIDFQPQEPIFDFILEVKKFNLYALNISKTPRSISGIFDVNLKNFDLDKVRGEVEIQNVLYKSEGMEPFRLDLASITMDTIEGGGQELHFDSELGSVNYKGTETVSNFPKVLNEYVWNSYPDFMSLLTKKTFESSLDSLKGDFALDVNIIDTKGLMKFANEKFGELEGVNLRFDFQGNDQLLDWSLSVPDFSFGNTALTDIYFEGEGEGDTSMFFLNIAEGQFGKRLQKEPMEFAFFLKRDLLEVDVSTDKVFDFDNKLEINADLFTAENGDLKVHIKEEFLDLPDGYWTVGADNELQFGKDYILAKDFILSRDDYRIQIETYKDNGLKILMDGFDLSLIDEFWDYRQMDFNGDLSAQLEVDDIMNFEGLSLLVHSDTFGINTDSYGLFDLKVNTPGIYQPLNIDLALEDGIQRKIAGVGTYKLPFKPKNKKIRLSNNKINRSNYVSMDFEVDDLPMNMLEYWIGAGVSNTIGNIDAGFSLNGPLNKMILDGEALITDAATTIDYLNVRYSFDNQKVALKEDIWEIVDGVIYDQDGNSAEVKGGIRHEYLRNLSLDALINTDKLNVLDTDSESDELYYGYANASGRASFTGTFLRPEFYITGSSLNGTAINIPVSYDTKANKVDFVEFINRQIDSTRLSVIDDEPLGIQVNMEMNLTEDAVVKIIFDEQAGDILEGRGNGNLQMIVTRTGDFQMYGDYIVSSGSYLFTLFDFLVNKQFQVESGGTIRWTGDPFGAELNLSANYGNLKAPVGGLISEYLVGASDDVKKSANYLHDVELSLLLSGIMTNPDVNFNLSFPTLTGELKNYVDTKMRILSQDQNQINLQVFGLIALGQFLPDQSNVIADNAPVNFGINTVTEVLSQQFSIYLTQLVQQWLEEDGLVSGIDFDVAYKHLDERNNPDQQAQVWDQFQFRINNSLFEDRLSVNFGGNLSLNEVGQTDTFYLAGDYAVEYELNNNNLMVRFYQSTSPSLINGRVRQTGLGLSYKKDFDDFNEFLAQLRKSTKVLGRRRKKSKQTSQPESSINSDSNPPDSGG